jgi:hypothetical protein
LQTPSTSKTSRTARLLTSCGRRPASSPIGADGRRRRRPSGRRRARALTHDPPGRMSLPIFMSH